MDTEAGGLSEGAMAVRDDVGDRRHSSTGMPPNSFAV
jgi:hypothetical protein